jgi:mono/diheme cytochrome c family protein
MRVAGWLHLTIIVAAPLLGCFAVRAETAVERGAYLVTTIGACGNCHSPRDASGQIVPGTELSGGLSFDDAVGRVVGPNITPDHETGIGNWTDAQIITALREGRRPDGTIIGPPMPIPVYKELSDGDAAAIAAYLRSLPPVRHAVGRTQYTIPLPPSYGPPAGHVTEPKRDDRIAYGRYLATFGHCVLCHTPPGGGKPFDMTQAFAGGRQLPDLEHPGAQIVSRNITSDPHDGIGNWTDDQVRRATVEGVRPDGGKLVRTMPFDWYRNMTEADVDAIVAFLRTIPPMHSR